MVHQGTQDPVGFIVPNRAAAVVAVEQSSPRPRLLNPRRRSRRDDVSLFPSPRRAGRIFVRPRTTIRRRAWTGSFDRENFEEIPAATLEFFRYLRNVYVFLFSSSSFFLFFFFLLLSNSSPDVFRRCAIWSQPTTKDLRNSTSFILYHTRLQPGCQQVIISREKFDELWKTSPFPGGEFVFVWRDAGEKKTEQKDDKLPATINYKRCANLRTWLLFALGNESRYHNCDNRASARRFIETSPGTSRKNFAMGLYIMRFRCENAGRTRPTRAVFATLAPEFLVLRLVPPRFSTMNFIEWLAEWHVNDAFMIAYSKRIEWIPPKESLELCEISPEKIDSFFPFFFFYSAFRKGWNKVIQRVFCF